MKRPYDWRAEASRIAFFGEFLTTLCGSCGNPKTDGPRPNCRELNNHPTHS